MAALEALPGVVEQIANRDPQFRPTPAPGRGREASSASYANRLFIAPESRLSGVEPLEFACNFLDLFSCRVL